MNLKRVSKSVLKPSILLLFCISTHSVIAQDTTVTIREKKISIKEAISRVEKTNRFQYRLQPFGTGFK